VTRLYNLGIEPYLVGATVSGVLAQRLVRKLCQHCKEPYEASLNEKRQIESVAGPVSSPLFKPRGCDRCRNIGFTGRIGIYELLVPEDAMMERISQGAHLNEIRDMARAGGMRMLRCDGMEKVKAGITTLEEVYRVTA
jgi:type II secretory ATPase GspE/PulE/Tfp pilus assembly ATPase PilB-like protein